MFYPQRAARPATNVVAVEDRAVCLAASTQARQNMTAGRAGREAPRGHGDNAAAGELAGDFQPWVPDPGPFGTTTPAADAGLMTLENAVAVAAEMRRAVGRQPAQRALPPGRSPYVPKPVVAQADSVPGRSVSASRIADA